MVTGGSKEFEGNLSPATVWSGLTLFPGLKFQIAGLPVFCGLVSRSMSGGELCPPPSAFSAARGSLGAEILARVPAVVLPFCVSCLLSSSGCALQQFCCPE